MLNERTLSTLKTRVIAFSAAVSMLGTSVLAPIAAHANQIDIISPERELLVDMASLGGKKLNKEESSKAMREAIDTYERNAPKDGREERMVEALSETGIMTPEKAQAFKKSLDSEISKEVAQGHDRKTALGTALRNAVTQTQGAQFSGCGTALAVGALAVAGIVVSQQQYNKLTQDDFYYEDGNTVVQRHNSTADLYLLAEIGLVTVLVFDFVGGFGTCY